MGKTVEVEELLWNKLNEDTKTIVEKNKQYAEELEKQKAMLNAKDEELNSLLKNHEKLKLQVDFMTSHFEQTKDLDLRKVEAQEIKEEKIDIDELSLEEFGI